MDELLHHLSNRNDDSLQLPTNNGFPWCQVVQEFVHPLYVRCTARGVVLLTPLGAYAGHLGILSLPGSSDILYFLTFQGFLHFPLSKPCFLFAGAPKHQARTIGRKNWTCAFVRVPVLGLVCREAKCKSHPFKSSLESFWWSHVRSFGIKLHLLGKPFGELEASRFAKNATVSPFTCWL